MKTKIFILLAAAAVASCTENKSSMSDAELSEKISEWRDKKNDALLKEAESWVYSPFVDEMTEDTINHAYILSNDYVNLDFPYEGNTHLTIHLRQKGNTPEAFIISSDGQITDDYNNAILTAKFDDGEPINFSVSESADNDSKIRFIDNASKFTKLIKASKKTLIKIMYYDNGSFTFHFDTDGLKWD